MTEFPRSLIDFQHRFPDEAACVKYLFAARWPEGFVCPSCTKSKAWQLQTKPWTWECAGCGKQTSVTARTIMHHSKLPLTIWFWAAYLMATHSNSLPRRRPGASRPCNCNASSAWGRTAVPGCSAANCAAACSPPAVPRSPASSSSMKPKSLAAARTIRSPAAVAAATRAS